MIRIFKQNLDDFSIEQYKSLFGRIDGVLAKRIALDEMYTRGSDDSNTLFDGTSLKIPFEKFIVDLATGYLSGKPEYNIDIPDETSSKVRKTIFEKEALSDDVIDEMKAIINYITAYNDDKSEVYYLIRDLLLYGACYETTYENLTNDLVYNKLDAINTVAIWDTSVPENLIAIISKFTEKDVEGKSIDLFRVIDRNGTRVYNRDSNQEVKQDESMTKEHFWNDVPGFAVELNFSIIENSESVIKVYETLLSNVRDTYKYNAEDCKMKISGYKAQNKATIVDDKGNTVVNPARIIEDNYVLSTKTFYTEEGGDAEWLTKPVDAAGVTTLLKYYVDMIFQLCGIPNTSDLAFNSADLNASAIDRKFYVMNMKTQDIVDALKKGLLRRFELMLGRINIKKSTKYDFRYINIDIPKNLPSMTDETVDQMIKLNGILSEETIIEKLGYDYETEAQRKEDESLNGNINIVDDSEQNPSKPGDKTGAKTKDSNIKSDEGTKVNKEEPTVK